MQINSRMSPIARLLPGVITEPNVVAATADSDVIVQWDDQYNCFFVGRIREGDSEQTMIDNTVVACCEECAIRAAREFLAGEHPRESNRPPRRGP